MKKSIYLILIAAFLSLNLAAIIDAYAFTEQERICCFCQGGDNCDSPQSLFLLFGGFREEEEYCDISYCPPLMPYREWHGRCKPRVEQPSCCEDDEYENCDPVPTSRINCNLDCDDPEK